MWRMRACFATVTHPPDFTGRGISFDAQEWTILPAETSLQWEMQRGVAGSLIPGPKYYSGLTNGARSGTPDALTVRLNERLIERTTMSHIFDNPRPAQRDMVHISNS